MTKLPAPSERIELVLEGVPVGKARPRITRTKSGRSLTYTPEKTIQTEEFWRAEFRKAGGLPFPENVPLCLFLVAYFPRPKQLPKGRRFPTTRPDLDNIAKLILDALRGLAYEDDAVFVKLFLEKYYAEPNEKPRVEVEILQIKGANETHP